MKSRVRIIYNPGRIQPYTLWDGIDVIRFYETETEAIVDKIKLEQEYKWPRTG